MHYYKGFGLIIQSEFAIADLMPFNDVVSTVDVTIKLGKTPIKLEGPNVIKKVFHWARPNEFLLEMPDQVRYHTFGGHTIVVEPLQENPNWKSICLFLLGSAMASILHQRLQIPLHASSIIFEDELILFCGVSGVGKSTTVAFLNLRGYPIFTDDVCVITTSKAENNKFFAHASIPTTRHWEDSIKALNSSLYSTDTEIREGIKKYKNHFHDSFISHSLPIRKVIFLEASPLVKSIQREYLELIPHKMAYLRKNIFKKGQLKSLRTQKDIFKSIIEIATHVPMVKISRPVYQKCSFNTIIDEIENEFKSSYTTKKA